MSLILAKCIEFNEDRKICTASENGKIYRLNNQSRFKVRKIKSDSCLAQSEGEKRYDYIMDYETRNIKTVIFIELKGGGSGDALMQIYQTIVYLQNDYKNYKIEARIVGSRDVPNIKGTNKYNKLAKVILKSKGTIEIGTNNIYTETI